MPQARLGDSVLISHIEYRIKTIPPEDWRKYDAFGDCHTDPPQILIRADVDGMRLKEVLRHEIEHAIQYEFDIRDGDEEERRVTRNSQGWTLVMRDNPWLVKFLS